jgi:spore coat protein U-like protein
MTVSGSALLGYAPIPNFERFANWSQRAGMDEAAGNGNGSSQALSVPSQILARRYVTASDDTDTITVTITY